MRVEVLIELPFNQKNQLYSYNVSKQLISEVQVGKRVKVDFNNRIIEGFIMQINNTYKEGLKDILEVVDEEIILNSEMIELGYFLSKSTLSSLINSYQTMVPKAFKASHKTRSFNKTFYLQVTGKERLNLGSKQREYYLKIKEGLVKETSVPALIRNRLLELELIKKIERPSEEFIINYDNLKVLSNEQNKIYEQIKESLTKKETFLLYGVTGSGKTEIYFHLIKDVIASKKSVIVLVPEISITTQMINRFTNVFGLKIAVLHSKLSDQKRYEEYQKILRGEVNIVLGARSAVFAPLTNLGLIIMDEEQSTSYKQESNPKYQTEDIAKWRSTYHNIPLVLGSATPKIESFARAKKGIYTLLTLDQRVNSSKLPEVLIVDMKEEYKNGNSLFSSKLLTELKATIDEGNQAIILLNRRGYATSLSCVSCGYTVKCPHCDISLTYHKSSNKLKCHYCGYNLKFTTKCPSCYKDALKTSGIGTEQILEQFTKIFPETKFLRMDMDTTRKKGAYQKIIDEFASSKAQVLIGTQMVAKGLDFKKVTLVGIINADNILNIPNFRSCEKCFELVCQTSGRAGRADLKGKVIIQTFNPDHYSIVYASKHDYQAFYNHEMLIRRKLHFSPYYYICLISIKGINFDKVSLESNKIRSYLTTRLLPTTIILGPTTANIVKVNNNYCFQIIIKYQKDDNLMMVLTELKELYRLNKDIKVDIDLSPVNI